MMALLIGAVLLVFVFMFSLLVLAPVVLIGSLVLGCQLRKIKGLHKQMRKQSPEGHSGKGAERPQRKSKLLYDRKRRHSIVGCKSLMQFLGDWLITQQGEKLVACNLPVGRRKTEGTSLRY